MSSKKLNGNKKNVNELGVQADIATTGETFDAAGPNGPALRHELAKMRQEPDAIRELFLTGKYPYHTKIPSRDYERKKAALQVELLKVQRWVKEMGQKVVVLFEGRDAAGKGGTIKRFMEHLNPRGARVVALEKPSEHERGEWYFQGYIKHLPTEGEIALFDRSWYNRAGVERVMEFCNPEEYLEFMRQTPFFYTDTADAPWTIIKSSDKKRARIACMQHFLDSLNYPKKNKRVVRNPDPLIVGQSQHVIGKSNHILGPSLSDWK